MEGEERSDPYRRTSLIPPLPRDSRGSLEVFNPTTFATRPQTQPKFPGSPFATWQQPQPDPPPPSAPHDSAGDDVVRPWMALPPTVPSAHTETISISKKISGAGPEVVAGEVDAATQRAAEWGLVLKTDEETGRPQGVAVRRSGEDSGGGRTRRNSGRSYRSSEDSDAGTSAGGGMPRVSEELRDALSAFQQTFVVSDATKPDYPVMYASAGFYRMTGYLAKEVIGRNCRFLQGSGTDPVEIAKIRETLSAGTSYCGRILNYKKDGTPFWNLLTIAPIKDEYGNILKYIGMQVEVSRYTEGSKDTMVRPNGLPESLIRYDARQKDKARSSV